MNGSLPLPKSALRSWSVNTVRLAIAATAKTIATPPATTSASSSHRRRRRWGRRGLVAGEPHTAGPGRVGGSGSASTEPAPWVATWAVQAVPSQYRYWNLPVGSGYHRAPWIVDLGGPPGRIRSGPSGPVAWATAPPLRRQ